MGKSRIGAVAVGVLASAAVFNGIHPGSAGEASTAASDAAVQMIHGAAGPVDQAIVESGPLFADARTSLQQSGIGNMVAGATTATTAAGGLPAPAQPATSSGQ